MPLTKIPDLRPLDERAIAAALRDTLHCPDCGALLGGPRCTACGADLTGAAAGQLLRVSQDAATLLGERALLRAALHATPVGRPPTPAHAGPSAPTSQATSHAAHPAETSALTAQQVLLGLGAMLVAVAAVVFTAVAWQGLGLGGRALILLTVTAGSAGGATLARRRSLPATAEALAALTAVLAVLDAYAARRAGLADLDTVAGTHYWGPLLAVGGLTALLTGARGALRSPALAGALALAISVPVLASAFSGPAPSSGVLVAGAAVLGLLALSPRLVPGQAVRAVCARAGGLWWTGAVLGALGAMSEEPAAAAGGGTVVLLAAVLALSAVARRLPRPTGSAVATVALLPLAAGPVVLAARSVEPEWLPLVGLVVAALLGLVAPRVLGARLAAATALVAALVLPVGAGLATAAEPFVLLDGSVRRTDLAVAHAVALALGAVLVAAAVRRPWGRAVAGLLLAGAAVVLPVALEASPLTASVSLLLPAAVLTVLAGRRSLLTATATATAVLAVAIGWAADRPGLLLGALLVAAATAVAGALLWPAPWRTPPALLGVLALSGAAATAGELGDLQPGWSAVLAISVAALALVGCALLDPHATTPVAVGVQIGVVLVAPALAPAADLEPARSVALTLLGAAVSAHGLRSGRLGSRLLGALLLAGASWSRLDGAGVHLVEAYTLPTAAALVVLGALTRRRTPGRSSWVDYGPGLSLALLPTLAVAIETSGGVPVRALVLAGAAAALTALGARHRLAAPLLLGAAVLLVDAIVQVGPAVAGLPRWVVLGVLGALLLGLGATYERRLAQARGLSSRLQALR